jgi:hypothetical protein
MALRSSTIPWAGLALGPGAWALNTQLNYSLVPWTCGHATNLALPISAALAIVAFVGTFVSWRAWSSLPSDGSFEASETRQPHRFLAGIGIALGTLFGLIILMQGLASLILDECAR